MTVTLHPSSPSVTVADGALLIHLLRLVDRDTVAAARAAQESGQDLDAWASTCIRAGAAATTVAATGVDLTRLERTLAQVSEHAATVVTDAVTGLTSVVERTTGPGSDLERAAQAQIDRLATGIGRMLAADGPAPAGISAAITAATAQAQAELRALFAQQAATVTATVTSDREAIHRALTDHLAGQQARLDRQLEELRTGLALIHSQQAAMYTAQVVAAAAPVASAGPGADYESAAVHAVSQIAVNAGYGGATPTGGTPGADGNKLGDAVIDFVDLGSPAPRLVIEAKRRAKGVTVEAARRELAGARSNRNAHYAILLAPADRLPTPGVRLQVLSPHDLALAWEPDDPGGEAELTAAILLLHLVADHVRDEAGDIDRAGLQRAVTDLAGALAPFTDVLRHAGTAEAALGRLKATAATMQGDLASRVQALRQILTSSDVATDPHVE